MRDEATRNGGRPGRGQRIGERCDARQEKLQQQVDPEEEIDDAVEYLPDDATDAINIFKGKPWAWYGRVQRAPLDVIRARYCCMTRPVSS